MVTYSYPLCPTSHELEVTRQENIYQRLIAETLLQNSPSKKDVCTPEVTYNAKVSNICLGSS